MFYAVDNREVALRFIDQLEAVVEAIQREPHVWPLDATVPAHLGVRRQRVDGFPYSVVYLETASAIHVLAIAHGRRKPAYWLGRLPAESR